MVMLAAIKKTDFSVICGFRGEKEQNEAYASGNSKLKWPQSKHNKKPSEAVDVAPWPIDWQDISRFKQLSEVVIEEWKNLDAEDTEGWKLEWGGNWTQLKDYPHFQIVRRK
jgi:peptidoglycan L-alanyl-D-glutamate endopeptidase CwlK